MYVWKKIKCKSMITSMNGRNWRLLNRKKHYQVKGRLRRETPQVETKSEELTVLFVGASLKVLPKVMGMHTLKVLSTNNNNAQLKVTIHNIVQNAILGLFHSTLDCYLARKNVLNRSACAGLSS